MTLAIDYVEFAVNDLEQSKKFYSEVFDWTFNDYGPEYSGIQDPRNPAEEIGGLSPHQPTSRGDGMLPLVRSDDVEATLARVLAAGGEVRIELHEYPGGRRFTFADPSGNILGVYQPAH